MGEVIAHVFPAARTTAELRRTICDAFLFGPERTQTQDPEFVLNELVEIAVRALSPAINDPATAVLCVDRLGAALIKVAALPITSSRRYSTAGNAGMIERGSSHEAFDESDRAGVERRYHAVLAALDTAKMFGADRRPA